MTAYYNEIDPYAAQWLRNLISAGHIAPGDVDERSITDVSPDDLAGYTQCHFFAGIGAWSYALRLAGWSDERPAWTGSCPCQPFSAAGKRGGIADERHLWPFWFHIIEQLRPPVVFGEQVASKDGLGWLDLVHADMEGTGYAFAAVDLCAAGVGAPHIRQRLWFVGELADADNGGEPGRMGNDDDEGLEGLGGGHRAESGRHGAVRSASEAGEPCGLDDTERDGRRAGRHNDAKHDGQQPAATHDDGGVEFASSGRRERGQATAPGHDIKRQTSEWPQGEHGAGVASAHRFHQDRAGPTNGHWRAADWLFCRDGKWRPVEPGTFPLAHGAASRVGRLRAYGNAIVAQVAAEFVNAYMECRP